MPLLGFFQIAGVWSPLQDDQLGIGDLLLQEMAVFRVGDSIFTAPDQDAGNRDLFEPGGVFLNPRCPHQDQTAHQLRVSKIEFQGVSPPSGRSDNDRPVQFFLLNIGCKDLGFTRGTGFGFAESGHVQGMDGVGGLPHPETGKTEKGSIHPE